MTARAARVRNTGVRFWAVVAREERGYCRERAWKNALALAEKAPGWMVRRMGLGGRTAALVEIESVGPRGGIRGRRWYKTRGPGVVRSW